MTTTATPPPSSKPRTLTGAQTSGAILFLIAVMVVLGWSARPGLSLVLVTASILTMLVVIGLATTNRPLGILINEQNLMSLARFQTVVWTVVVLGAYLTFALVRIKRMAHGAVPTVNDPLAIQIDPKLWALIGISTTSLVGSPLILSTKKNQTPPPSVTQKTAQLLNEPQADITANCQGALYANPSPSDASLTDMFEGDEVANTAHTDLAKVQMFYFTVIAAVCFQVTVFKTLTCTPSDLSQLPTLSEGLVAILGISHAGYLGSKGINRNQSPS